MCQRQKLYSIITLYSYMFAYKQHIKSTIWAKVLSHLYITPTGAAQSWKPML